MIKKIGKLLLSFILVPGAVIGLFVVLNENGYFDLNRIEILMENALQQRHALRARVERLQKDLSAYQGQSLWNLGLNRVTSRIREENWIESFHVVRKWPSTLEIQVKSYPVLFVFLSKKGEFHPVLASGDFLESISAGQVPDVPLVRDEMFRKNRDLRQKLIRLLKDVPTQGRFSRSEISEIHYDAKNGFSFTLVREGLLVKIGEDQIRMKSLRVSRVLEYLDSKKFQARVIDANLSQKVLVRLRKQP